MSRPENKGPLSDALHQRITITNIRKQIDEETFMAHWQKLAGGSPLFASMVTQDLGEQILDIVIFTIYQGIEEQR